MPRNQKFTDDDLITALVANKGNISHAARELGVSRTAVKKRADLLPAGALLKDLTEFRKSRSDVFADIQQRIIANITADKLKKASLQQLGTLFGIMYDKERLEQNLSTENIAHDMVKKLDARDLSEIKEYIKKTTERKRNEIVYEAEVVSGDSDEPAQP